MRIIACENNFRNADPELAELTFHVVTADVARLAARVKRKSLFCSACPIATREMSGKSSRRRCGPFFRRHVFLNLGISGRCGNNPALFRD